MKSLTLWITNIKVYPCTEVVNEKVNQKTEKRLQSICEALYRFNYGTEVNILGELKANFRELEVLNNLGFEIIKKPEYLKKVLDSFKESAKVAIVALDAMHKEHQLLNAYYKSWRLSYQDVKKICDKIENDYIRSNTGE